MLNKKKLKLVIFLKGDPHPNERGNKKQFAISITSNFTAIKKYGLQCFFVVFFVHLEGFMMVDYDESSNIVGKNNNKVHS